MDYEYEEKYAKNCPCDNTGYCAGSACPQYYTMCHTPEQNRNQFN